MKNSKWNYIAAGVAFMSAIFGALIHNMFLLLFNLFFVVLNWYAGEHKRHVEEQALINAYELTREEIKND